MSITSRISPIAIAGALAAVGTATILGTGAAAATALDAAPATAAAPYATVVYGTWASPSRANGSITVENNSTGAISARIRMSEVGHTVQRGITNSPHGHARHASQSRRAQKLIYEDFTARL